MHTSAFKEFFEFLKMILLSTDQKSLTTDHFISELEKYLELFFNRYIKKRLNYLNGKEYIINYVKQIEYYVRISK